MKKHLAWLLIAFVVLGTFMALDKTVGHWYVPKEPKPPTTTELVAFRLLGTWNKSIP